MKKAWLLNLLMLCIVAALASVIYFSEEKANTNRAATLTDIDSRAVKSIRIEHNGHVTRLQKHDGKWRLTEPVAIAANDFRIKTILQLLEAPVRRQYALGDLDAGRIGLQTGPEKPVTRVAFDNIELVFGIINPATNLRYIRIDNRVYAIEDVYYPLLTSHFGSLVSLKLMPEAADLQKLALLNQTLEKDSHGNWQSSRQLDGDRIIQIIDRWQSAQAFGIHAYMPRRQLGEISIHLRKGPAIHFTVTDTEPWVILARPDLGLEYHLEREAYDNLLAPQ